MEEEREEYRTTELKEDTVPDKDPDQIQTEGEMPDKEPDQIQTEGEVHDEEPDQIQTEEDGPEEETSIRLFSAGALKFIGVFAAGFAACLAVFAAVMYGAGLGRIVPKADYEYYQELSDRLGKYYVIMDMIGEDPLVKEDPEEITEQYIRKMIEDLDDPYAAYYTSEEYDEFKKPFEADFVGIGILVSESDAGIVVEETYEDGPAAKAGIAAGDEILKVDGVVPADLNDAVSRITGEAGTEVTVTIGRNGTEKDYTMKRAAINLDSVGYSVSEDDPKVGYIRMTLFTEDTDEELRKAVSDLQAKGCDKFILDLRDNGGGLTDISIKVADYLLPECRIMTDVTKNGKETVYDSKESSAALDLVVLVNENTASAAEILTAAIQENGAGTVIGTKTYGKGVTQVTRQFRDGSAVKLTVSEYLTPKGHHVQDNGIQPDIEATEEDILDKALEELRH